MEQTCPNCHSPVNPNFYFCPNCGKKLKEPPVRLNAWRITGVIAISILAPPFGLLPGIRYIRQKDSNVQVMGLVVIVLTIISSIATIWYSIIFVNNINKTLNSQLNQLNIENPNTFQ